MEFKLLNLHKIKNNSLSQKNKFLMIPRKKKFNNKSNKNNYHQNK